MIRENVVMKLCSSGRVDDFVDNRLYVHISNIVRTIEVQRKCTFNPFNETGPRKIQLSSTTHAKSTFFALSLNNSAILLSLRH